MQSLKSTFVAVLLLGLSLGLYQISDTPKPLIDESLIPAVDISDGTEQLTAIIAADTEPVPIKNAFAATTRPLKLPELQQPAATPAFGSDTTVAANAETRPKRFADASSKNEFATQLSNDASTVDVPAPRQGNVQSFAYPDLSEPGSTKSLDDRVRQRELDSSDRDQGLIAALQNQQGQSENQQGQSENQQGQSENQQGQNDLNALPMPNNTELSLDSPAEPTRPTADTSPDGYQYASAAANVPDARAANSIDLANLANTSELDSSELDLSTLSFTEAWPQVDKLVAESRYRDALELLTRFYHAPDTSGPQRQRLLGWLDALAGKVIFSAEHHFRPQPYTVNSSESLVDLAARWQVPAQLIYNINRSEIPNPASLAPGTQLKVVDRPFDATIDLSDNVLTLFSDGLYAGRYPVFIGISGDIVPGDYRVMAKAADGFRWRDAAGNVYPPDASENGYGPHWIGLSGSLCMHALKNEATDGHRGCLGLSPTDAADIFQILSKASTVTVVD